MRTIFRKSVLKGILIFKSSLRDGRWNTGLDFCLPKTKTKSDYFKFFSCKFLWFDPEEYFCHIYSASPITALQHSYWNPSIFTGRMTATAVAPDRPHGLALCVPQRFSLQPGARTFAALSIFLVWLLVSANWQALSGRTRQSFCY